MNSFKFLTAPDVPAAIQLTDDQPLAHNFASLIPITKDMTF